MAQTNHLTREQIESIVDGMTARDIFAAMPGQTDVGKLKGAEIAGDAFEHAAERQGHGALALDRVPMRDATYLGQLLGEALDVAGPKADDGASSPGTATSGDKAPKAS